MANNRSKKTKVIAISSGKGGVGKSNIAANLSISIAQAGHNVCLFDADINLANINILLGLSPLYTLQHLFTGNKKISDIVINGPAGIDIIAGASGIAEFTHLDNEQQQCLLNGLKQLEKNYDYLIIDTAAGVDDTVLSFLHAVPYLILTITREPTSLTDAFSLLKVLKKQGYKRTILVVVNMVNGRKMAKQIFTRFSEAVSKYLHLNVRLAGFVVMDGAVSQAVESQQALLEYAPESSASICIESIAMRLLKVLEKSQLSEAVFTDFFTGLVGNGDDKDGHELLNDLVTKASLLSDTEGRLLYEKLADRFNHIEQPKVTKLSQVIVEQPGRVEQIKPLEEVGLKKNVDEGRYIIEGLKHAMLLAARLGK